MSSPHRADFPAQRVGNFVEFPGSVNPTLVRVSEIIAIYPDRVDSGLDIGPWGTRIVVGNGLHFWTTMNYREVVLTIRGADHVA
jgi:hypothetical protein